MTTAHQYTCSGCAFQVRSENADEVVEIIRDHARDAHDMSMSKGDVRSGIEELAV